MDIQKILAELRAERERIEEAILALERLKESGGRRRNRSPRWEDPQSPAAESSVPAPASNFSTN